MLALDVYRPDQWHDFFVTVGGGAAALTGLVFVAMSLNLGVIAQDATHRYRAIGTLVGFTAVFVICASALMGDLNHVGVGIGWAILAGAAGIVYVYGYVQAMRTGASAVGLGGIRLVIGTAGYLAEIAGGLVLVAGYTAGLYVAAAAMVLLLAFMISGAWLLIVGVSDPQSESHDRPSASSQEPTRSDHGHQ